MPGNHARRQNDKWRFWSTRFFRFSVLALVIFLVMQYGFSALVTKQHMMWARIRNMYSTNRTHNQIRDSHNVTGHMWKSTRYVNSHLQTNTPTLPAASTATTDLLQSTSQLAAASTVTTDLQQNATVQAQYVTSIDTASTQAASVTLIDTASTQALSVTSVDRNKTLVPCPPLPPNLGKYSCYNCFICNFGYKMDLLSLLVKFSHTVYIGANCYGLPITSIRLGVNYFGIEMPIPELLKM